MFDINCIICSFRLGVGLLGAGQATLCKGNIITIFVINIVAIDCACKSMFNMINYRESAYTQMFLNKNT